MKARIEVIVTEAESTKVCVAFLPNLDEQSFEIRPPCSVARRQRNACLHIGGLDDEFSSCGQRAGWCVMCHVTASYILGVPRSCGQYIVGSRLKTCVIIIVIPSPCGSVDADGSDVC